MALRPGTRLNHYEVTGSLGSGGMGEVYRASDTRLGRAVALKVLSPDVSQYREAVARFEQEARAASALNHPNIIHIYEIGEAHVDERPVSYIAMELIEGQTLRVLLDRRAPFGTIVSCLIQVADALASAHEVGVVHRDLKPENILVSRDAFAKVADFGLAKLTRFEELLAPNDSDNTATIIRTQNGVLLGTVGYMSPEQVRGERVDQRSDVFAFGCVLYESVTGSRPFHGATTVETLHKTLFDEPPQLHSLGPRRWSEVVSKCLAKSREDRFQSMRDVARELREVSVLELLPLEKRHPSWRRPGVLKAWGAVLAAAAAIVLVTLISPWSEETESQPDAGHGERVEQTPTRRYDGERINIELNDADIRDVLKSYEELTGLQFRADPQVSGVVSVRFTDVPWDQAFELFLLQNGLTFEREGQVIRVATVAQMEQERRNWKLLGASRSDLERFPGADERVTLDGKPEDLRSILLSLGTKLGANITIDPEVTPRKVQWVLRDVTAATAFNFMVRQSGLAWQADGSILRVSTPEKLLAERDSMTKIGERSKHTASAE